MEAVACLAYSYQLATTLCTASCSLPIRRTNSEYRSTTYGQNSSFPKTIFAPASCFMVQ